MKKFYQQAVAGTAPGGFTVRLDGKNIKTPLQHPLIVDSQALAEAIAAEFNAQGAEVVPASMPLTQLTNTMIDKGAGADRAAMTDDLMRYASSDLICYFATHPADLVARQEAAWQPLLDWMATEKKMPLTKISGIRYEEQPVASLRAIANWVAKMPPAAFTAFQAAAGALGSVVIALALVDGRLTADEAFAAATVDETYQIEKWGEDTIARQRLDRLRADLDAVALFLKLS